MALSDIERKILINARDLIKNRQQFFVCDAIELTALRDEDEDRVMYAKNRLRDYISSSLGSNMTLGGWLSKRYGNRWLDMSRIQRAIRVQWITWMLGEEPEFEPNVWREIQENMEPKFPFL